ncbi:MAG: hypothetical protein AAGA85_13560 [Bacteroidota bacterium]
MVILLQVSIFEAHASQMLNWLLIKYGIRPSPTLGRSWRPLVIFVVLASSLTSLGLYGQVDSIRLTRDQVILFKDSLFVPTGDTIVTIPTGTSFEIKKNQYYLSEQFYAQMDSNASKIKVLGELYNFLISYRPPEDVFDTKQPVKSVNEFVSFEGKTIKSIDIIYVDVGVGSVTDTTIHATGGLAKTVNNLHVHTQKRIIKNNLLVKAGDLADPYRLADSERLLRALSYVEDARIELLIDPLAPDEVYMTVIVKDRFPWGIDLSFASLNRWGVGVNNRNILGFGDLASINYLYSQEDMPSHGFEAGFQSRNIRRSFVNFTAFLADNYERRGWSTSVSRDFVSPQILWGGEFSIGDLADFQDQVFADSVYVEDSNVRNRFLDTWVGRAIHVGDRANISVALRYLRNNFISRPAVDLDFNERLHDRDLFLGAIGFNKLNFFKTRNIRSFNITEDAPVGLLVSALIGRDLAEFETRTYLGGQVAGAMYNEGGYFGANLEMGTFVPTSEEGRRNNVLEVGGTYFSPLFRWGRTYIRNFLRTNLFISEDLSIPFTASLREGDRVRNINGLQLQGNQMITASFESTFFLPWYVYGFRFAPYALSDFGHVEENRIENGFRNSYLGVGGGLRIRNESLVLDTFEMRFVFFPLRAPEGDVFRFRISTSAPVIFRAFNVNKPLLAVFE